MINITIGGKERTLRFNQYAMEVWVKNTDFEAPETSSVYAVFFAGLIADYYVKRVEPDFSFADVVGWVDELSETDLPTIEKVAKEFAATTTYQTWLKNFSERLRSTFEQEANKKKVKHTKNSSGLKSTN